MGTPEFAVASLKRLVDNKYNVVAVNTVPDKPVGRGQKIRFSPIKEYAIEQQISVLQPLNLKDSSFLQQLEALKTDLQIVVAFRMLPIVVWEMPLHGTFNLHASLLPEYRGAAPINWALINGEEYTGITTFFINENIDTGSIILKEKIQIFPDENASSLHDRLMIKGADLVIETVKMIEKGDCRTISQDTLIKSSDQLKPAPKLHKDDCKINWNKPAIMIFNFIRGLSEYPGAYTELNTPDGKVYSIRITKAKKEILPHNYTYGTVLTDRKEFLKVAVQDGFIHIVDIQLSGKKKMDITSFLRGFKIENNLRVIT